MHLYQIFNLMRVSVNITLKKSTASTYLQISILKLSSTVFVFYIRFRIYSIVVQD